MTIGQIIGAAMLAAPFVALFIAICTDEYGGWRDAVSIFGGLLALVAFTCAGAYLLTGGQ